ncbi:MAG: efflux RND transporter periplasmic adaptor subunit [Bryobacteraceae bacterium]
MPVTIATATVEPAPMEVRVVGSVDPSEKVEIKSQVAGQLTRVHFKEGQDVREGELLLEIDSAPYREALRQAQATVERDRAQLKQAEFAVQRDIAQAKGADADAERYASLRKEHVASEQQELQYRTAAEALKETIRADRAAVETARGSITVDEAAVSQAKLNLSYCQIRAPISGRAGNLLVNAGNLVKVNDVPLVVINRITPVFVNFNVPEKHLQAIRRYSAQHSLPVEVASREDAGIKEEGRLTVVDNTVDTQTGTIHLKATFENTRRHLWPGQFVDVVLTLNARQDATVVPAGAVQPGQKGQFVYVVKPDKTVEPRIVSVGRTLDRNVIVENGISPGEVVVTDGQMLLFPGAHISVAPAPKTGIGVQ